MLTQANFRDRGFDRDDSPRRRRRRQLRVDPRPDPRHEAAKQTVADVLANFGWGDPVDIGGIEGARELEAICIAWVKFGGKRGAWDHGFKLLAG